MKKSVLIIFALMIITGIAIAGIALWKNFLYTPPQTPLEGGVADGFKIEIIHDGLVKPWDIAVSDNGTFFFTQRGSGLFMSDGDNTPTLLHRPEQLSARGEGGMMGLTLSDSFNSDKTLFVCYNRENDVVVEKVTLSEDEGSVLNNSFIIEQIPTASSGRHSGCRLDVDSEGFLWVTTGDSADSETPQDLNSLGGKILRVDANGNPHPDNSIYLPEGSDPRIFSYGHRNVQGIVLLDFYDESYGYGFSTEHGPSVDDEINPLLPGNFGWDPISPYIETVPMTDLEKYPNAIEAVWESGGRTIAISAIERVEHEQWGSWEGSYLVAALKDSYILRFELEDDGNFEMQEQVVNQYGRIRDVYQASDGSIYFSTDNGEDDIIAEIVPNF